MTVGFNILCETNEIELILHCPNGVWCGIVFNKNMNGDAVVFMDVGTNDWGLYDMYIPARYSFGLSFLCFFYVFFMCILEIYFLFFCVCSQNRAYVSSDQTQ